MFDINFIIELPITNFWNIPLDTLDTFNTLNWYWTRALLGAGATKNSNDHNHIIDVAWQIPIISFRYAKDVSIGGQVLSVEDNSTRTTLATVVDVTEYISKGET